ncbi:MAG: FMN-binding negative transcriptional regulator [Abitibacteriaceae bacterium]|nr:FMN-binding negative transcriptional regulator [Abditibacteriaceae bacterium]MBV9867054.1 FMN-binding negative transcriptional regulator [Abditibacteriaceae bacterium]
MYIPSFNRVEDFEKLATFMRQHSFATLITYHDHVPYATHLPLLLDADCGPHGTLRGHLARSNEQWQHFTAEQEVLVIFHGPHAYVSPSYYEVAPAVATWNYVAVHAYGVPHIIEDQEQLAALLQAQIETYEAGRAEPWPGDLPADYKLKMMRGIVGFEIPITRLQGKWKLGQNRSQSDQQGVYAALRQSSFAEEQELAAVMETELNTGH